MSTSVNKLVNFIELPDFLQLVIWRLVITCRNNLQQDWDNKFLQSTCNQSVATCNRLVVPKPLQAMRTHCCNLRVLGTSIPEMIKPCDWFLETKVIILFDLSFRKTIYNSLFFIVITNHSQTPLVETQSFWLCRIFHLTCNSLYVLSSEKNGTALETDFRVKCDVTGGEPPLFYTIRYNSSVQVLWYHGQESVSPSSQLPAGQANDYMIPITVEVQGRYGSYLKNKLSVTVSIVT